MPVDVETEDVEPEDVRVYHAIFTEIEMLPWKSRRLEENDQVDPGSIINRIARFFTAR